MERIPGIDDDSLADSRLFGSCTDAGEENGDMAVFLMDTKMTKGGDT
jgi:hypothetical protein